MSSHTPTRPAPVGRARTDRPPANHNQKRLDGLSRRPESGTARVSSGSLVPGSGGAGVGADADPGVNTRGDPAPGDGDGSGDGDGPGDGCAPEFLITITSPPSLHRDRHAHGKRYLHSSLRLWLFSGRHQPACIDAHNHHRVHHMGTMCCNHNRLAPRPGIRDSCGGHRLTATSGMTDCSNPSDVGPTVLGYLWPTHRESRGDPYPTAAGLTMVSPRLLSLLLEPTETNDPSP